MLRLAALIGLLTLQTLPVAAQDRPDPSGDAPEADAPAYQLPSFPTDGTLFWVDSGFGALAASGNEDEPGGGGPAVFSALAVRSDEHVGTARGLVFLDATQVAVSLLEVLTGTRPEGDGSFGAGEVALMYGRPLHESQSLVVVASLGLSSVTLFNRTESTAIGLPAQLDVTLRPTQYVGVSLSGVANVNRLRTFGGALFTLRIGKLH